MSAKEHRADTDMEQRHGQTHLPSTMPDADQNDTLRMPALTKDAILAHPHFFTIEKRIARHLVGIHEKTPRLARLKASHRKWLLTQSMYALQLQRDPADPLSGLTASRLYDAMIEYGAASRNTATAFLAELVAYKFLRPIPAAPDKRLRLLETTEAANQAMMSWFMGHMVCLDELDGGNREAMCLAHPLLFRLAQPRAAGALIEDPAWREPPPTIGHFLWSESGGMLLHELITRIGDGEPRDGRIIIGDISIVELAEKYAISVTNTKRMFMKAEGDGLLGWEKPRRRGALWFTPAFLHDYFSWQAVKFAALDDAMHWADAERLQRSQ